MEVANCREKDKVCAAAGSKNLYMQCTCMYMYMYMYVHVTLGIPYTVAKSASYYCTLHFGYWCRD